MSSDELKKFIIEKIKSSNDEQLLLEATRLMEIQLNEIEVPFILTNEMNQAIDEAKEQILNGNFLHHDQANNEIEKWLEE